jgi:hypothetical protein
MTPLNYSNLEWELSGHPNRAFTSYVLDGVQCGFDLGFRGSDLSYVSRNMKSALDHPHIVDAYIAKELCVGRIFGPFESSPFPNSRCSPIGVVPKKVPGKFRLIMDLSYPSGSYVNDAVD